MALFSTLDSRETFVLRRYSQARIIVSKAEFVTFLTFKVLSGKSTLETDKSKLFLWCGVDCLCYLWSPQRWAISVCVVAPKMCSFVKVFQSVEVTFNRGFVLVRKKKVMVHLQSVLSGTNLQP